MRPESLNTRELLGSTFACIPGCGFCCTFPPEAKPLELAALRARIAPRPLLTTTDGKRRALALHNKCGACTLLERRECSAYDLRPQHCRYFPFHVHFAPHPEALLNYQCRGVERAAGGDLTSAFAASVLAVAKEPEWKEHEERAVATYAEFARHVKRAGVGGDVAATVAATDVATLVEPREESLAPFAERDVTLRPFHLALDLEWLTFEPAGDGLRVLSMDEKGALDPRGTLARPTAPIPPPLRDALGAHMCALARRAAFEGQVFAIVDDADYKTTVADATRARLAQMGSDLAVRANVLLAMGTPPERVADEAARFYDSAFLDAPTIGGWL